MRSLGGSMRHKEAMVMGVRGLGDAGRGMVRVGQGSRRRWEGYGKGGSGI